MILVEGLKSFLKARGVTYKELAMKMNLSEVTLKRTFSSGNFSLDRFLKVCEIAHIDFNELVNSTNGRHPKVEHEYTLEQEKFFVKNPKCLAYFDLLLRFGTVKEVARRTRLTKKETDQYLLQLDRHKLIESHAGRKIKFPVGKSVKWRKNGPLRNFLLEKAKKEFLSSSFGLDSELFRFSLLDVSAESQKKINIKIEELLKEISAEANMDQVLKKKTSRVGVLFAARSWDFSALRV